MKVLPPLNVLFILLVFFLSSTSLKSQKQFSTWKDFHKKVEDRPNSLTSSYLEIKEAISLSSKELKGISAISILEASSSSVTALLCSDDAKESKWFKVEIKINEASKINDFRILDEGFLKDKSNKPIGGVEGVEIYGDNFYVSLDNDVKGEKRNYILRYELSQRTAKWKAAEKIELVKEGSFPTMEAYKNAGLEALTITDDGNIFTIYELGNGYERDAWLKNPYRKDLAATEFKYTAEYKEIKGATTLSDGNIIILEKEYDKSSGTRFSIQQLDRKRLNKGKYLYSKELLRTKFNKSYFDNFEGITSFEMNKEEYVLIVSDNNDSPDQNTLLFLFELTNPDQTESVKDTITKEPKKKKSIRPELIPYPQFSQVENLTSFINKKNRQIIYDTKLGSVLTKMEEDKKEVWGIPQDANIAVAITPRTLRGIVTKDIKYFTVSIGGEDFSYKNSLTDLYEPKGNYLTNEDTSSEDDTDFNNNNNNNNNTDANSDKAKKTGANLIEVADILPIKNKNKNRVNLTSDSITIVKQQLDALYDKFERTVHKEVSRGSLKQYYDSFKNNSRTETDKSNFYDQINKIIKEDELKPRGVVYNSNREVSRLKKHFESVLKTWEGGDQYFQYLDIKKLVAYKDTLEKAVLKLQSSGKSLNGEEMNAFHALMSWMPTEIYLTTFSPIAPDNDEIDIKLKTFGESGSATNEFQIAKKRISTGLSINLGTAVFLTGLKSNQAYINDTFPTSDTTTGRRVMMPSNNQFSIGFGANAELSFRTASIVRPMVSLGFFVPLGEKVTPLFAIGGGVTIGTQKVKLSISAGAAFGSVNAIKEQYLDQDIASDVQLSDVTEEVWNHSWQASIGISYNIVGTKSN